MESNNMICDPAEGICSAPVRARQSNEEEQTASGIMKVIYFTDPICSSCWGIEPQLRRLKLEYGSQLEIEYRMGGLLPDWSYNSGGISKPSDVASHWDEVSLYYNMPIDGDVWLEDPLHSSYPPSIAFKAAQMQDQKKAILFLRALREMVFLRKMNITRWENLALAAKQVGLDADQLKEDYEGAAIDRFEDDLSLARQYRVRGFPTMFFVGPDGKREMVYGSKPYGSYHDAIQQIDSALTPKTYDKHWEALFDVYPSLTWREFSELTGISREDSERQLNELVAAGKLERLTTKNGSLWSIK